jgi:hypothetical protein
VHRSSGDAVSAPPIQWYPGHIAKAEQQLKRNLEKVDLVIEVRDARIPFGHRASASQSLVERQAAFVGDQPARHGHEGGMGGLGAVV